MTQTFGLYLVITDPVAGHAACTEAAVRAGLRFVQLRMKDVARDDIVRVGHDMRAITKGTSTRFIVNDDVEVARLVDADGVHVGQDDMQIAQARALWPDTTKIFGLSTHDEAQARAATAVMPSYIGVGPLFATPTKRNPDPVLGVARAASIIRESPMATVAIGGIDRQRLREVLAAGIRNYAVVRYVCQRARPFDAIRELLDTEAECLAASPG